MPPLKSRLLIVEDDASFLDEISGFLSRFEFDVSAAASLAEMRDKLAVGTYSLILLDQFLGGEDALPSIMALGMNFAGPIVILTANTDPTDIILGLEMGAHDFIHKTQPPREILARIRAAVRRTPALPGSTKSSKWTIDRALRKVTDPNGHIISLTSLEYTILVYMAERPGISISREILMEKTFKRAYTGSTDRTIDMYISRLRSKLSLPDGPKQNTIRPDRSVGYIMLDIFDIR